MAYGISNYVNSLNSLYGYNQYSYNVSSTSKNTTTASLLSALNTNSASYAKNSYFNTSAMSLVSGIKESSKNMLNALSNIRTSAFSKQQAVSKDTSSLTVNAGSSPASYFRDTKVSISQIATAQLNKGSEMSTGNAYAKTGIQQFQIESNGTKYQFAIDVKTGDTNKAVQQKMASAINSRNIGITATTSENPINKTSILSLLSQTTGADNKNTFSVSDITGSLAFTTGISAVTQNAQDARYSINGGAERISKSNSIALGYGVSVTLQKATSEAVTVTTQKDTSAATDAVQKLVDHYNSFLASAKNSTRLTGELSSAYRTYAPSLNNLGIAAKTDGTLSIDKEKLGKAAEDGRLENFFTRASSSTYGFTGRLTQIASSANINPASYASTSNASSLLSGYFFNFYA